MYNYKDYLIFIHLRKILLNKKVNKIKKKRYVLKKNYLNRDEYSNYFIPNIDEKQIYQDDLNDKRNRIIVGFIFSAILTFLMYFPIHVPFITMGELSLIITIIPFLYVSLPITNKITIKKNAGCNESDLSSNISCLQCVKDKLLNIKIISILIFKKTFFMILILELLWYHFHEY